MNIIQPSTVNFTENDFLAKVATHYKSDNFGFFFLLQKAFISKFKI